METSFHRLCVCFQVILAYESIGLLSVQVRYLLDMVSFPLLKRHIFYHMHVEVKGNVKKESIMVV